MYVRLTLASAVIGVEPPSSHPFEHWTPPVSVGRRRYQAVAVVASVALHGLLLLLAGLCLTQSISTNDAKPSPSAPIRITLEAASEPPRNASRDDHSALHSASSASLPSPPTNADVPKTLPEPKQSLSADSDKVPPRVVLPANISAPVVASKKLRPLLISPEAVAEAAKAALAAEQDGDGFTTQGAVVLDPALREQLNTALRRTGNVGSEGSPEPVFDGAGWMQQVQIGKKCFRVQSANPLDSTSREAWYPSPCPR
jgi:hypothetical protein